MPSLYDHLSDTLPRCGSLDINRRLLISHSDFPISHSSACNLIHSSSSTFSFFFFPYSHIMCGRFCCSHCAPELKADLANLGLNVRESTWIDQDQFRPRYNVAPRSFIPVVRQNDNKSHLVLQTMVSPPLCISDCLLILNVWLIEMGTHSIICENDARHTSKPLLPPSLTPPPTILSIIANKRPG